MLNRGASKMIGDIGIPSRAPRRMLLVSGCLSYCSRVSHGKKTISNELSWVHEAQQD